MKGLTPYQNLLRALSSWGLGCWSVHISLLPYDVTGSDEKSYILKFKIFFDTTEILIIDECKRERYFVQMSPNLPTQFLFYVLMTRTKLPDKDRMAVDTSIPVRSLKKSKGPVEEKLWTKAYEVITVLSLIFFLCTMAIGTGAGQNGIF